MVDVYVNYDCDISYSNLFDNIITTLYNYATSPARFGVLQRMGGAGIIDIVEGVEYVRAKQSPLHIPTTNTFFA